MGREDYGDIFARHASLAHRVSYTAQRLTLRYQTCPSTATRANQVDTPICEAYPLLPLARPFRSKQKKKKHSLANKLGRRSLSAIARAVIYSLEATCLLYLHESELFA